MHLLKSTLLILLATSSYALVARNPEVESVTSRHLKLSIVNIDSTLSHIQLHLADFVDPRETPEPPLDTHCHLAQVQWKACDNQDFRAFWGATIDPGTEESYHTLYLVYQLPSSYATFHSIARISLFWLLTLSCRDLRAEISFAFLQSEDLHPENPHHRDLVYWVDSLQTLNPIGPVSGTPLLNYYGVPPVAYVPNPRQPFKF